jgi:hypothetical protein
MKLSWKDKEMARMVYELYGLMEKEIGIVERGLNRRQNASCYPFSLAIVSPAVLLLYHMV